MSETSTSTVEAQPHPLDSLHRLLTMVVDRLPWHSEVQYHQAMALARESEAALKGDQIDTSPAVVPPAPVLPAPVSALEAAAGAAGQPLDYAKLAEQIVLAQKRLEETAATQAAQAEAAVAAADPGWTPPGSVTASPVGHAGADAVSE